MPDFRVSDNPDWQPYSENGEVVTLEPKHCRAIHHALRVYARVQEKEGSPCFDYQALSGLLAFMSAKSCLMGRLLYDGKAPLVDAPPTSWAAPDYSLEESDG